MNPVPNPAAANPFAYAGDDPLTGTDPSGHYLVASSMGGPWRPAPSPRPAPPVSSCGSWCLVTSGYHHLVNGYYHGLNAWHRAATAISRVYYKATRVVSAAAGAGLRELGHTSGPPCAPASPADGSVHLDR